MNFHTNRGTLAWLEKSFRDGSIDLEAVVSEDCRPCLMIKWPNGKSEFFIKFNPLGKPDFRYLQYEPFYKFDPGFGLKQRLGREAFERLKEIADAWCAEENAFIEGLEAQS